MDSLVSMRRQILHPPLSVLKLQFERAETEPKVRLFAPSMGQACVGKKPDVASRNSSRQGVLLYRGLFLRKVNGSRCVDLFEDCGMVVVSYFVAMHSVEVPALSIPES